MKRISDISGWNPRLYEGSASFYRRGRLPYAPGLTDALAKALDLDGSGRLIDVGCGPGTLAISLAGHFVEVVGVDADADMLAEASLQARAEGISNARWLHRRAEALPAGLGAFSVATFAQSFHWMARGSVARSVRGMLEAPRGALVLVYAWSVQGVEPRGPMPHPRRPAMRSLHWWLATSSPVPMPRSSPPRSIPTKKPSS